MGKIDHKTFELKDSVYTPDAGQVTTILVSASPLDLPWTDKSVAVKYEESTNGIFFSYRNGDIVIIPYSNIRYIYLPKSIPFSNYKKEK